MISEESLKSGPAQKIGMILKLFLNQKASNKEDEGIKCGLKFLLCQSFFRSSQSEDGFDDF